MQVSFRKILWVRSLPLRSPCRRWREIKIGVVDYARLFEESPQAKVVADSLRAEFGPRLKQLVTQEKRSRHARKSCRRTSPR